MRGASLLSLFVLLLLYMFLPFGVDRVISSGATRKWEDSRSDTIE